MSRTPCGVKVSGQFKVQELSYGVSGKLLNPSVRFEDFTVVITKITVFCDAKPCDLVNRLRRQHVPPPKFCQLSTTLHGATSKMTAVSLSQDGWSPDRDLNAIPANCKAGQPYEIWSLTKGCYLTDILSQGSWCLGRDLNRELLEYKSGALPRKQPPPSVLFNILNCILTQGPCSSHLLIPRVADLTAGVSRLGLADVHGSCAAYSPLAIPVLNYPCHSHQTTSSVWHISPLKNELYIYLLYPKVSIWLM
jgi:hypothetical protein